MVYSWCRANMLVYGFVVGVDVGIAPSVGLRVSS